MLSQCFVRYANTVLVSMTQEIKNISKRKDEGVGKKSFRYLLLLAGQQFIFINSFTPTPSPRFSCCKYITANFADTFFSTIVPLL